MEFNYKFTGVWIPKEIWVNEKLAPLEKLLWAELYSLDGDDGCFASNEYLAKILDCSPRRIQQMLSKLRDMRLVKIEIQNRNQRIIRMAMQIIGAKNIAPPSEINFVPPTKNISYPPMKNISPIDTSIIDTNKDTNENSIKGDFELVWKAYGRIGNKVTSYKSYQRLCKKDQEAIMHHIPIYIAHHITANKKPFIPHFSTYLNQRRWEDELPYQLEQKHDDKWAQFGQKFI